MLIVTKRMKVGERRNDFIRLDEETEKWLPLGDASAGDSRQIQGDVAGG